MNKPRSGTLRYRFSEEIYCHVYMIQEEMGLTQDHISDEQSRLAWTEPYRLLDIRNRRLCFPLKHQRLAQFAKRPRVVLVERYRLLDVLLHDGALAPAAGLRILERDGDRVRLLVDRTRLAPDFLAAARAETIAEIPMTLEELFLALVGPTSTADARSEIP